MIEVSKTTHDALQSQCFIWAHNTYPEVGKLLFAVPNEVKRIKGETAKAHMIRVMQFKSLGVVPGVFDLLFYWKGKLYAFDIKVGRDTASIDQVRFGRQVQDNGGYYWYIADFQTFQQIFTHILNSTK